MLLFDFTSLFKNSPGLISIATSLRSALDCTFPHFTDGPYRPRSLHIDTAVDVLASGLADFISGLTDQHWAAMTGVERGMLGLLLVLAFVQTQEAPSPHVQDPLSVCQATAEHLISICEAFQKVGELQAVPPGPLVFPINWSGNPEWVHPSTVSQEPPATAGALPDAGLPLPQHTPTSAASHVAAPLVIDHPITDDGDAHDSTQSAEFEGMNYDVYFDILTNCIGVGRKRKAGTADSDDQHAASEPTAKIPRLSSNTVTRDHPNISPA